MKKTLLLILSMVFCVTINAKVVLDFTSNTWGLPESSGTATTSGTYTNGTYSITIDTNGSNGAYYSSGNAVMIIGKTNATLTLPTMDFDVERIVIVGGASASESVVQNIYVGEVAVSTQTTGARGTMTYEIASDYQTAGTQYVLKITSNHNSQIATLTFYGIGEEDEEEPEPTGHGYEPDDPYTCEEAIEIISALASGGTITDVYVKGIVSTIGSYNSSWGELIYYISDDGTTSNQLEIYDGYYLNNEKFTSDYANELMVGDEVIVYGTFTNYYGNTPEGSMGATYIYSLTRNGETVEPGTGGDGDEHSGEVSASGTTVTLTNPGVSVGTETTSIDFTTMSLSNAEDVDGREFSFDDGSTVVFAKGNGTITPKYYNSGTAIRLYADNTATFSCSKCIAKIEIHTNGTDGNTATEIVDFSEDGTTAVYCNLYTSTSGGTYLYVQSITIYYAGESEEEPEPEPEPDDGHTFNFADNTYGMTVYTSGNDYETEVTQIVSDGVVLNFDSGHYRIWNSSSEGNSLRIGGSESSNNDAYCTISGPAGSKVLEVVLTSTGSSDNMSASNPTADPEGISYSSHVSTWTGEAESVTFHFTAVTHIYYIDVTLDTPAGDFTITSVGYATYYTDEEYTMPEGVVGTTITGIEDDEAEDGGYILDAAWEYVAGSTVPAQTALVLKGEEGTYTYTVTSTGAAAPEDNLLQGSSTEVLTTGPNGNSTGYYFYELTVGDYGVGFYWANDEGSAFTSEAHKAWLTTELLHLPRFIGFGEGSTTGISAVESSPATDAIYTIQGVRVSDMSQKGIYIVGGKKVLVK